jgi:hypothetical protein
MRLLKVMFAALLLVLVPASASAAVYRGGETQTIGADEVISENVYIAGASVVAKGTVEGDLIGAGSNVVMNGTVTEDVALAGGNVDLLGDVDGDVRVAGGNVTIVGDIGGELVVAGGTVHVFSETQIQDNLVMAGGRLIMDGTVNGDMHFAGGDVSMNGTVEGMMNGWVEKLAFGPSSAVNGPLNYRAPREANVSEGASLAGPVDFKMVEEMRNGERVKKDVEAQIAPLMRAFWIMKVLALVAVGLLLVYVFPKQSRKTVHTSLEGFWENALWGLLALVAVPFLAMLLLTTGIGWMLAGMLLTAYVLVVWLAGVAGSVAFGFWLEDLIASRWAKEKKENLEVDWRSVLVGVVALGLVGLLPIIGWFFIFVWFLAALGAMAKLIAGRSAMSA